MKFALLGVDNDTIALTKTLLQSNEHHLVGAFDADPNHPLASALLSLAPAVSFSDAWETLLDGKHAQAVLVAHPADYEIRHEQLRKLAQAGVPLLLAHPACEAIVAFELEMIRRDTGAVMAVYFPGIEHPAFLTLEKMARPQDSVVASDAAAALGAVEQVVFERSLDRSSFSGQVRQDVLAQFTRDGCLTRRLLGEITKVQAMGLSASPTISDASYANLSVHMTSSNNVLARWSAGLLEDRPMGKLTVIGSRGKAVLFMPENENEWRLECQTPGAAPFKEPAPENEQFPSASARSAKGAEYNGPQLAVDAFIGAISSSSSLVHDQRAKKTVPWYYDWSEAARDLEITEAVERSLERGRTIELHHEEHTEEGTFKSMMAAGGCVILLLAIAGLCVGAMIGSIYLPNDPAALAHGDQGEQAPDRWPFLLRIWPVYPLAIFLLLQLLRLVFRSEKKSSTKE